MLLELRLNIPPHFHMQLPQPEPHTLAVSSTAVHKQTRQRRSERKSLTLFCCPWFSYNIATARCCRLWAEYYPPPPPPPPSFLLRSQPSRLLSVLSDTGRKLPRPHAWRWGQCSTLYRLCSRLCGLNLALPLPSTSTASSAPPCLFPTTNTTPGSAVKDLVTSARQMSTLPPLPLEDE